MKIYEDEKSLADLIQSTAKSISRLVVPVRISSEKTDIFIANLRDIEKNGCKNDKVGRTLAKVVASHSHPDLMYASAILVSTVMNKNDDVFLPEETWQARLTPINTPYNDEHVETDIIGHIIAARPLDSEGKVIEADEAPSYFDIEVDFVVYKSIFPAIAKEIEEKAPINEKFVSMELVFSDFDYGLVDTEGSVKIVSRNKDTAFLTKYLRAFGGDGLYQDYKVARVLRNFRFVGMGSVDNPANPKSEYTKIDEYTFASDGFVKKAPATVVIYLTKGNIMEIKTIEDAVKIVEDLNTQVQNEKTAKEQALAKVTEYEGKLTAETNKVEVATSTLNEKTTEVQTLAAEVAELKTKLQEKTEALEKIDRDRKTEARVNQLKELGIAVATEQKRAEISGWSDETFASVLEFTKSLKTTETPASNSQNSAEKALDNVVTDTTVDASVTPGHNEQPGENIQKAAAKLADELFKSRKPRNSNKKE
jgi:hypothetical protein